MTAHDIASRIRVVEARIVAATHAAARPQHSVRLVAVSKGHGAGAVREAVAAGQRVFGENYVAEMLEKKKEIDERHPLDVEWHFIGRIQRNKARDIAQAALVHSVGATRHLEALAAECVARNPLPVLLQVNIGDEPQKNGFSVADLRAHMGAMLKVRGTVIRGLMTVPPVDDESGKIFQNLREIRDDLQVKHGVLLPELSMGMTADFKEAIAAGATLVRIGTAIFGDRQARASEPTEESR